MAEEFGSGRGGRAEGRRLALENSMRAHPAGRALCGSAAHAGSPPLRTAVPPAPARLRLTARGRRLVTTLALTAGVGGAALGGGLVHGSGDGLELVDQSSVVVHSGDTLWSIADSIAGDDDVRDVVDRIREVNGLHGSDLVPGEVLVLP